jgi:hypothetical protein
MWVKGRPVPPHSPIAINGTWVTHIFIIMEIKETDNRETPKWLMGMYDDWFDPCPLNPNPSIDGLGIDWKDKTYVNPPYSNIRPWVTKAISEAKKGNRIVMLLPADVSTKYFADLMTAGAHVAFFHGRLKFSSYKSPAWGSMLVFL